MRYGLPAVERAMKMQEIVLRAMSGTITWLQAADILRLSPRTVRRWRARYERQGYDGLLDRRGRQPSPRRVPLTEVERVLRLYRERYLGFNVRHFLEIARREHGVTLSYSFVRQALQGAGLVAKRRPRGRHRLRREPRACVGEMLHLDGSPHAWLALVPDERQTLMAVVDDATTRVLYAQLVAAESTETVMAALRAVFAELGLPMALYPDRAGWAFYTPKAGGAGDKTKLTQVGRALKRLGVEHIPAYSPQARRRGGQCLPAHDVSPGLQRDLPSRPPGPGVGLCRPRPGRSRPDALSRGRTDGRQGQHRRPRWGPPSGAEAAGTPVV